MTGDRRKHPRPPIAGPAAGFDGAGANGRRRAPRDPAAAHFRRLGESDAEPGEPPPAPVPAGSKAPR